MFHKPTFLASLHYPPTHPKFPAVALLHAILAVTAPHLPASEIQRREYFPVGTTSAATQHPQSDYEYSGYIPPGIGLGSEDRARKLENDTDGIGRFQMWHRRKSFEEVFREVDRGGRLLQLLQGEYKYGCLFVY